MSFRKRMIIAFAIILVLPLVMTAISFFVISSNMSKADGPNTVHFENIQDLFEPNNEKVGKVYDEIYETIRTDPEKLESTDYLNSLSSKLEPSGSFMLVRRNDSIYYTDSEIAASKIRKDLPLYQGVTQNSDDSNGGWYIEDSQYVIRQLDFTFSNGDKGSVFILSHYISAVSGGFVIRMLFAMLVILAVTAALLIHWINSGVLRPVHDLDVAMAKIKDGDFDYMLPTDQKGEIGDLYRSYEDMRLRLKESADEKMEQEKANSELIRNISHDLKTPITSVKGYVEGLMDGVANTPEKQKKYLQTIYNKANDMDRLINELTLYSKIDNDRIPYNFRKINITDYFGDCVEEIGMDMESRGISLNYTNMVSPDTLIIADPEQLKRVVNNIISNSVKYMDKPKQRIDIRILDEQDSVRIEIEDNGKGIAARDLPNIFDRFYRTDASRASATGGSGIGLSIVKKIVEDHGGYIWATSREGEGTCMHMVFRKYHEKEADDNSVDASAKEEKTGSSL